MASGCKRHTNETYQSDYTINHSPATAVIFCHDLFVFVALRPMSTAMVIAGRSVHLTTLFPGQA